MTPEDRPVLLLIRLPLTDVDLDGLDRYEAKVLARLPLYGGELLFRLRARDDAMETHGLSFPSQAAFDLYLSDPVRQAAQAEWLALGIQAVIERVVDLT